MDFITGMFKAMFSSSTRRYKARAKAKVRAATVGKVQAKVLKARSAVDKQVAGAQDKILPGGKKGKDKGKAIGKGKGPPAGPAGAAPAAGTVAAGAAAGRAPVGPGVAVGPAGPAAAGQAPGMPGRPVGPGAIPQQGAVNMGKGKRNKNQAPMGQMNGCMQCGAGLQPDWDMCPYCGSAVGAAVADGYGQQAFPQQGGFTQPQAPDEENKTVAINIDDLNKKQTRPVVGWIVAQNGNHRGHDFRLYDGKNLLGTAADCDIVVTDPYLSAKHCTIRHEDGNFVLIDLDSTNGTFVNQKRVSKMELIDNDTVRFGRTEFKFKSLF